MLYVARILYMHVVFLTRKFPPAKGGMETFSWQLTQHFPTKKTVIHYGRKKSDIIWAAPLLLLRGILISKRASLFHLGDLVLGPIAPLLKWFTHKPIVVTVHALELTYGKGTPFYTLIQWSLKSSAIDQFVAVSHYTAGLLQQRGVAPEKIVVIPHGVVPPPDISDEDARQKIADLLPNSITDTHSRPLLLTVGRLVQRKGVAWFIEHVLPRILDLNPLYLVVSDGPDQERIKQTIETQKLQNYVQMLGKISDEALLNMYAGSDMFITPNIPLDGDAEGFGFVSIEAAAAGLPVLASNIEGIPDAIHDGRNGKLMTPGDAAAYEEAIRYWCTHPDERKKFGQSAQQYTLATFQWQHIAEQYKTLFETVISRT